MTVSSSPTPPPVPNDTPHTPAGPQRVVLLGNPNTGKTSLFNRLCGVRHKTSNFPGTTQEARVGPPRNLPPGSEIIDLPGIYSLELEQSEAEICRRVLSGELAPRGEDIREPDAVLVVADATKFDRRAAFQVCALSDLDVLISDTPPEAMLAASLHEAEVTIR